KAMEVLCEGLNHPESNTFLLVFHKIIIIFLAIPHRLSGDILTESSSRNLAEVLRKNQRLNRIVLSLQNPDDKAMEVLCEGLNHPECAIKTLQLFGKILTESSSRHLAEVLRKSQRLNVLYLSLKNPDDKAMEVLCEGLNHPECAIKTSSQNICNFSWYSRQAFWRDTDRILQQASCRSPQEKSEIECIILILTESSSRHLAEVLRKNQRLNVLYLSFENPDDKAMEVLCEVTLSSFSLIFTTPFCDVFHKIIVIFLAILHRLFGEILTESSSRHLAEVLRKNQRLNVLYLSLKYPDDKAMEVLCEGLNHPECAIKTLQLSGEILTESSSRHLAEVLRKNERLNRLDMSLRNLDDKAMEVLCEGLKHPECAIETLE
uniref:NACHT LRR and PYD domain-containing protein n=1 Tax=Pseudonaja textilis TaxID=8673 RepID=A0A670ZDL9_PSETE